MDSGRVNSKGSSSEAMQAAHDVLPKTLKFVGLGFWQAWWMGAMCSQALFPFVDQTAQIDPRVAVTVATDLGYLFIIFIARWIPKLSSNKLSLPISAATFSLGTFLLALTPYFAEPSVATLVLIVACVSVAIGNASLLMMWGELWSELSTGRVGRYLYLSFLFAFVLFFLVSALPTFVGAVLMVLFPIASAFILYSCENEPRRSTAPVPLDLKDAPIVKMLLGVFIVSVVYGLSENIIPYLNSYTDVQFMQTASMEIAGICLLALVANIVLSNPVSEALTLYKPFMPLMALGLVCVIIFNSDFTFIGNGFIILGIYCLDMLLMLVSTDISYRTKIPVAFTFGVAILCARLGTLAGTIGALACWNIESVSEYMIPNFIVVCLFVIVAVSVLLFNQSSLEQIYRAPVRRIAKKRRVQARRTTVAENTNELPSALSNSEEPLSTASEQTELQQDIKPGTATEPSSTIPYEVSLRDRCDALAKISGLTAREVEVLELLIRGRTVQDVCDELSIARGTAKHHVSNIYRKTGVSDRRSLYDIIAQVPVEAEPEQ